MSITTGAPTIPPTASRQVRGRARGVLRGVSRHHSVTALVLYLVTSLVIEHNALLHPNSVCACNGGADPTQFMWALVWWPHAILHGLNPFWSHVVWYPRGMNVAEVTSIPFAAIVAWPLTAVAGPVVSFNVLTILAPVLGAWFAYRLCLYLTRSPIPSIVGGYLFGFSTYELSHMIGLLHTEFTFAIPAAVLLVCKHLDGVISARRFLIWMSVVLIVQLGLSTELLFTMTWMGVATLLAAFIFSSTEQRRRIVALLPWLAGAYLIAAIVCSPYLYYELIRGAAYAPGRGSGFQADLTTFVIPTRVTLIGGNWLSSVTDSLRGNLTEDGSYLGIPLLIIVVAYAAASWRTRTAKILLSATAVALIWSLGARLAIAGHLIIDLPYKLLASHRMFDQLAPVRVAVFVALGCAVAAALWLAAPSRRPAIKWVLAGLAAISLLPNLGGRYPGNGAHLFHSYLDEPSFFTTDLYKRYLRPGDIVLPLPWGSNGQSLLWQARTEMSFNLASGYFEPPQGSYQKEPIVRELHKNVPGPAALTELRSFIGRYRVRFVVVSDPTRTAGWLPLLSEMSLQAKPVGGVLLYQIPSSWT